MSTGHWHTIKIMNKKPLLILAFIIVILAVSAGVYMSGRKKASFNQEELSAESQTETNNIVVGNNQLVTDDFSMELPAGWSKTIDTVEGVLAMAANPNEIINDPAAQKINFKSYLAVSFDAMTGKTMEEYMQSVKDELQKSVPGVIFANESNVTINGRPARAIEAEMTQQGTNFKVLIVAVQGNGDDVWVLSYNTVKSSWDGYVEAFAASAKSFILKK